MWDLKACPGKFLRITPTEIEFESNFSSMSQHLRSNECSNFLIAENFENLTLWDWMWGWFQQFIYLSDHWKFLRITPFEIEFQSDFSKFVFNSNISYQLLRIRSLRLNLGVISAINTVFIIQELSDCRLRIRPLRLNVRTISAVYLSTECLSDCFIRVTVLLEYFDLLWWWGRGPLQGGAQGKLPQLPPLLVALKSVHVHSLG